MIPAIRPRLEPEGLFRRIPFVPHQLTQEITPARDLFVLSHLGIPRVGRESWTLDVAGLVRRPLRLTLTDLARYPRRRVEAFHQCAGNPMEPEVPTRRVANVVWGGVALADVLEEAGIEPGAAYLWSYGADHGTFDGSPVPYYLKDLPLERLAGGDVLLADEVGGVPLSAEHGFPLRLVVPGFYGTNSVKWLYRIAPAATRADGLFTTRYYNDPDPAAGAGATRPVWAIAPEAVIVDPAPGSVLPAGPIPVEGWAWADGGVAAVELSQDGGRTWSPAAVDPPRQRSWQRFRSTIPGLPSGEASLWARATDLRGQSQPLDRARNAVHRVPVRISEPAPAA